MTTKTTIDFSRKFRAVGLPAYSNRELIDDFIAGVPAAADIFHDRYSVRISRWVWRLIGADREHEDLVQQVFANIFSTLSKIKKAEALDSWVDSVTIRTVRFELRKRKVRRALFLERDESDAFDIRDRKSAFKQNHIRQFYKILGEMPADDRIVFVLRCLEGRSIEDIATIGKYSLSTAKRRLKRAKGIFARRALEDFALVSLVEEYHAV